MAIDINATAVELLFTDVSVGQTFAQIAGTSSNAETVQRNISHAREAFHSIQKQRPKLLLTSAENERLDAELSRLKESLRGLGQAV